MTTADLAALARQRLRLLHAAVPEVGGETPEQHLRNAIQLLILADERLAQLTIPPDPQLTELVRGAEARVFRALFELGKQDALTAPMTAREARTERVLLDA